VTAVRERTSKTVRIFAEAPAELDDVERAIEEMASGIPVGSLVAPVGREPLRSADGVCQRLAMGDRQRAWDLYERGYAHEMEHDLISARKLLEEALAVASAAGAIDIALNTQQLLGVVAHKEDRLDDAGFHLEEAFRLAVETGDRQGEAYARQELGFLLLDCREPLAAMEHLRRSLALSPGVGIVNLAGNALNGIGAALLDLGRVDEAIPCLQASLAIRVEIGDLETQHVDLVHLARAALLAGDPETAAAVGRFLSGSAETAKGMYGYDRRALDAVLAAVADAHTAAAGNFEEARGLVATLVPGGRPEG
jgi:tetratricopeptide (TPR) repeat protein